jgi:hypothetical protein
VRNLFGSFLIFDKLGESNGLRTARNRHEDQEEGCPCLFSTVDVFGDRARAEEGQSQTRQKRGRKTLVPVFCHNQRPGVIYVPGCLRHKSMHLEFSSSESRLINSFNMLKTHPLKRNP